MSDGTPARDLDELLALNGVILVVDPSGKHWVKFVAIRAGFDLIESILLAIIGGFRLEPIKRYVLRQNP